MKVRQVSKRQTLSEWRVRIDGTLVWWRQKEVYDSELLTIKFDMVEGDFALYKGEWRVLEVDAGSRISLVVSVDWDLRVTGSELAPTVERKARLAIRWMLRSLRKRLGFQTIVGQGILPNDPFEILSERIIYTNNEDQRIVAYLDHIRSSKSTDPFIVIPPGYGETKRDAISVAYYLAKNGFRVLRYDATNHIGESDGDVVNTTLTHLKNDLIAALNYIEQNFEIHRVGIVASSLAKRVSIKAAVSDKRIGLLVGLVGVVDLRETLRAVYKEDMIGSCLTGKRWGLTDVLGFEVSGQFLETAIADRFHDLETTKEDLSKLDIPIVFMVAENDAWVRLDQVRVVLESSKNSPNELFVIPEALHRLEENPRAARQAIKQIILSCSKYLRYSSVENFREPTIREMATQNRLEKERLKSAKHNSYGDERIFWEGYLSKFYVIIKSPDYRRYLEEVIAAAGHITNGDLILDAGCGNGHLGAWLLARALRPETDRLECRYVGLDFAEAAVNEARQRHKEMVERASRNVSFEYTLADLNKPLDFPDRSFDKIYSSLVLSYLDNPIQALREFMRILRPGGKVVVTSLKPHNDLSLIYRNFVDVARSEDEIREGRRLLSNVGQIRQKESEGKYQFFSKAELIAMLATVNARNVQGIMSFGNQACIVSGEKGNR